MESFGGNSYCLASGARACKRPGTRKWDNYATQEDILAFMTPFRDSIWHSNNPMYTIKSGFAMPGMDNSGCAGWGRGHFFICLAIMVKLMKVCGNIAWLKR